MARNEMTPVTESMINASVDLTNRMKELRQEEQRLASERRKLFMSLNLNHNFTQREIARLVGLDPQTIHNEVHREQRQNNGTTG
jgi:predicted DNA-binding protein YlxM (UPF0122 family)